MYNLQTLNQFLMKVLLQLHFETNMLIHYLYLFLEHT